jgi:hypothetical protein
LGGRLPLLAAAAALALAGCAGQAPSGRPDFPAGLERVAEQRMRFAVEAVCLNNGTRASQDRAAQALRFPIRERRDGGTNYVNPETLTFLRIGPAPAQTIDTPSGRRAYDGIGCSVGSPAVAVDTANRLVGEILAPRLVEGDRTIAAPVGAGRNEARGIGLFFEELAVTVPPARSTFVAGSGDSVSFDHPVILILRR